MKQVKRADDVGLDEFPWAVDRAIYMALGSEVHDRVWAVLREDCAECCGVAKIDLLESVIRIAVEVGQRLGVAGISQLIEVDDGFALLFNEKTNEI